MNPQAAVERIRNVRFTSVNFRRGYDTRDVDDLLDALEAAVLDGVTLATVVAGCRLSTVRFQPGYAIDEVDEFLTELVGRGH